MNTLRKPDPKVLSLLREQEHDKAFFPAPLQLSFDSSYEVHRQALTPIDLPLHIYRELALVLHHRGQHEDALALAIYCCPSEVIAGNTDAAAQALHTLEVFFDHCRFSSTPFSMVLELMTAASGCGYAHCRQHVIATAIRGWIAHERRVD